MEETKQNKTKQKAVKIEAEAVLDCLDWDILVLDRDFQVFFANKAFLNKSGKSRFDVCEGFCYKLTHHLEEPCKPPHDTCPLEEMIKTGKPAVETHTHFGKNDEKFLANVVVAPMKGLEGEFFLHVSMPVKDPAAMKEETEKALERTMYILNVVDLFQKQMHELETTKNELETKLVEVEKFNQLSVDREMKMIELKNRIAELEKKAGGQ